MVDCNLLDLAQINDDQRRAIIEFVREHKGVKPKDLGVTDAYLRMVRLGKARAGDVNGISFVLSISPNCMQTPLKTFRKWVLRRS